jgi:hypothetical protein
VILSKRITCEMIMRIAPVIGVMVLGVLVASCSSVSSFVADTLPPWAGGLPEGTPPRPGTPGYDAYLKSISGNEQTRADPGAKPADDLPARKGNESIDEPVH